MNLSILTIRRPVLSIVLSILIVLLGVVGYLFLGVRQFPDVDPPNITVTTTYTGANADVVESQITEPLEESINGIAGIRSLTSQSSDGRSQITVEFELGEDLETAANDVRDRVERAKRLLPPDVDPPVVAKADANSQAILVMTVQSTRRRLNDLSAFGSNVLKERLQTIPGVGAINIWGERKYAMRLVLDPDRLAAYGLTTSDIRTVLTRENIELPAGRLEGVSTELTLRTLGRLATEEEFSNVILRSSAGMTVRIKDVARVYLGAENERTILKRNGIQMIGLAISPQPGANQVEIADEFYRRYDVLKKFTPKDIVLDIAFDNTKFIRKAILEVEETLAIAFSLVVLIIFIFLRSWRATLIPVIVIPVSLVSGFFFMWISGFSINILTLLGIVLATGLVVDDAIVVMENIFRRIEQGEAPIEAGEKGSSEIYFAIVSTTLTLAIVFIPIIFLPGLTGRLFREFGLVVACTVLVSAFVSLTLTPMMSSRLLHRVHGRENWLTRTTEPFFTWLNSSYESLLNRILSRIWLSPVIMIGSVIIIVLAGSALKSELAPLEDRSVLTLSVTAPEGTTFDRMDVYMDSLQARVSRTAPEARIILTVTSPSFFGGGNNTGFSRTILIDPEERKRSQMQIADALTQMFRGATETRTVVIQEQTISTGQRSGLPVQYVILASTLDDLREILPKFIDRAEQNPMFTVVDVNLKFTKPEVTISIDRTRARELGVSVADIADVLQAGFAGQRYGYFMRDGKQYQVIGDIERADRSTPDRLLDLGVHTKDGRIVPLVNFVTLTERSTPPALFRYNRNVAATVSAGLVPGATIGDGIEGMDAIASEVLDERYSTTLSGASRDFAESSSSLLYAFLLALAFVYLVLAAQFESFVDPLTIMLTVPLALSGGVVSLWITGETLNIFSEIGAIVLIGLVTKNGILIVEFANKLMQRGATTVEAASKAAVTRFRPILMTSLATMLGALPIALSLGASSGSRAGLGVVVMGGVLLATLLTLFVIPSTYILLSILKRSHIIAKATIVIIIMIPTLQLSAQQTLKISPPERISMREAISVALQRNFEIRQAVQDSLLAETAGGAAIVGFLPTFDITAGASLLSTDIVQNFADGRSIIRPSATGSNVNANAVVEWTVFDGLKMFASADRAKAIRAEGLLRVRAEMNTVIADVITAYNALVAVQTFQFTVDSALVLAEERYRLEKQRHEVGTASGVELAQAMIDLNSQKALAIRLKSDLNNASSALQTILGYEPSGLTHADTVNSIIDVPPRTVLLERAVSNNPDLLAAIRSLDGASAHVRELTSTLFPIIDVRGGYTFNRSTSEAGFFLVNQANTWSVGSTLQWNIFNGTSDKLAREAALIEEQKNRISIDALRNDIAGRVDRTYRLFELAAQLVELERSSYQAAQNNANVALEKLRIGSITPLEVRQTFFTLIEIGERVAQLEYERRLAATELLRLSGMLIQ